MQLCRAALQSPAGAISSFDLPKKLTLLAAGVTRGSSFPDIGAQEWTYCRMMETMLRSIASFDVRFIIRNLTLIEGGLHVLKHIPMTPLYPDRTVLQVRQRAVLNRCRQPMLRQPSPFHLAHA